MLRFRVVLVVGMGSVGCDDAPAKAPPPAGGLAARSAAVSAGSVAPGGSSEPEAPPPAPTLRAQPDGRVLPVEFPNGALAAKPGAFVLAPTEQTLDEALRLGVEQQTFVYYGARMDAVGPEASRVSFLPGRAATLPNALILPASGSADAKPGDIVLTAWASGTGLQRAIVVEGGATPKVRYLDLAHDHPSGFGQRDDTLPAGSYRVLTELGAPGTTVACEDGRRTTRWIVVGRAADKLLGLGFAGRLRVFAGSACAPVPLVPRLKVGDAARVPLIGAFTPGKVVRVDTKVGRVAVRVAQGKDEREHVIGFANVLP
ncbi:MAG: hypothetical protein KF718_28755 [Polyangiaceae bacterium]|nr:hypothetical protein [Polyangiaceae bacterium]